ncbi:hypothetical protein BDV36DRAFT_274348 [Aspergillus pseudocaelatus]|uniref:Uncharacterized protein n=1 Tax=Aspergillus pseudocaelatus TaxID=1825620 RepID=A0ABQ6W316_9EURO|nr:hypothetical protein BDV36DRAFT_274348 [Aspergillus pseudocaelatus]
MLEVEECTASISATFVQNSFDLGNTLKIKISLSPVDGGVGTLIVYRFSYYKTRRHLMNMEN